MQKVILALLVVYSLDFHCDLSQRMRRERERKINWLYPLELRRTGEPRPHLPTSLPSLAPFGQSSCPDLRQIRKTIKEGNPQTDDLKGKEQCDLIGRFLKVLGNKVPFKSSPNIWQQIWAIVKNGTFYIKLMWILFGQLLQKIGLLFTPTSDHT